MPPAEIDDKGISNRELSPEPVTPAPSAMEFHGLSIPQQFAYTKLILQSILNDEYPAAKERHDAFMSGGSRRIDVCRKLGAKGSLRNDEYEALSDCVQRWALKGNKRTHCNGDNLEHENGHADLNGDASIAQPADLSVPQLICEPAEVGDDIVAPQPIRQRTILDFTTPAIADGGNEFATVCYFNLLSAEDVS